MRAHRDATRARTTDDLSTERGRATGSLARPMDDRVVARGSGDLNLEVLRG
jgi:hypothetical protein